MAKKILTVDDLIMFCEKNQVNNFDSSQSDNCEYILNMPATFAVEDESDDKHLEGLLPFTSKAFHDHTNLNKSNINEDTFKEEMPSANFRPILANIVEDEDGIKDFGAHDYHVVEEDGEKKIVYDEQPIGAIDGTQTTIEFDEEAEVNRAILHGYLYAEYCSDAIDILQRRGTVDCSVELSVRKFSYDASKKVLNLDSYCVSGLTLLGANYNPGMAGSDFKLDDDVSKEEFAHKDKLVEILEKLEFTLSNFNMKKGGQNMSKFEELLQKYSKTAEDVTFEYESLSDEELEAKFEEIFGEHKVEPKISYTVEMGELKKDFSLSLNDKLYALNSLVNQTYGDDWYSVVVFEDEGYIEAHGFWEGKHYRQSYTQDGDNFSLVDDRIELFARFLTQEECDKLEADRASYEQMKADYEVLKQYKEKVEYEAAHAEKMNILVDYSSIENTDEYKTLIADIDKFTKDEIAEKADAIVGKYARQGVQFSFAKDETVSRKPTVKFSTKSVDRKNVKSYSALFD